MMNKAEINGDGNVVIQDADKSEIIINMNNPEEIKKFFIDFQDKLSKLPKAIIDLMESKNTNDIQINALANVYLSLELIFTGTTVIGITFSVTVTNLTKEHRYFNSPFFKSSEPFEGELDTFILPNSSYNNNSFPKRLEYGEVFKQSYSIYPQSKEIYLKIAGKNPEATIQVFVNTTIGELFASNEYKVKQLLENFKYSK